MAYFRTGGGSSEKTTSGSFTMTSGVVSTVDIGFKPKKLFMYCYQSSTLWAMYYYDEDISTTSEIVGVRSGTTQTAAVYPFTSSAGGVMTEVNDTGFKFRGGSPLNGKDMIYKAYG